MTRCSQYGCWIELQTAMPSPSGAAMNACGSMANWVTIGKRYVPSTTTSARAASTSPQPYWCSRRTFVAASGSPGRSAGSWTSGAAGSRAAATVKTAGSSSYSTRTSRAASSAASLVSAATAATGSPWYFVSPEAMTGRSSNCGPNRGIGCGQVGGGHHESDAGHRQGRARVDGDDPRRAQSRLTSLTWRTSSRWMSAT